MNEFVEEFNNFFKNLVDCINNNREYLLSVGLIEDSVNRLNIPKQEFFNMPADKLFSILQSDILSSQKRMNTFINNQKERVLKFLYLLGETNVIYTEVPTDIPYSNICFNDGIKNAKLLHNIGPFLTPTSDKAVMLNLLPFTNETTIRIILDLIFKSN